MLQKIFLTILSLLLLSSCSSVPEKEIVTVETFIKPDIPTVERPKALNLSTPYFHVVTKENLEGFIQDFKKKNGSELVFYAMSVRDYEKMALNLADLRRYIEQQEAVIVYYETAIERIEDEDPGDNQDGID